MKIKMVKKHAGSSLFGEVPDKPHSAGKIHRLHREDLKQLETGYQESLDLSEVCRRGLDRLRGAISPEIELDVNFPAPGPIIKADAYHIQQILIKLATTTREDTGHGILRLSITTVPRAEIPSTHRLPLDWQPKGKFYACLEIADAGIGIEAENIQVLFDQFYTCRLNDLDLRLFSVVETLFCRSTFTGRNFCFAPIAQPAQQLQFGQKRSRPRTTPVEKPSTLGPLISGSLCPDVQ
jgi:hypothetical protein